MLPVAAASHPCAYGVASALALKLLDALPQAARTAAAPYSSSLAHISVALRERLGAQPDRTPDVAGELRVRIQSALVDWFLALAREHTLVLLVVFIIAAPLLTYAIKLDLPAAQAAPAAPAPAAIEVSIDAGGALFWNGSAVDVDALGRRLKQAAAASPQPELHLRADRAVRYRAIQLGRDYGAEVEVNVGLRPGETVVVHPGDDLPEATVVDPVPQPQPAK